MTLTLSFFIQKQFVFLYWVKDSAMEPNFQKGSWVLFSTASEESIQDLEVGDVIIFAVNKNKKTGFEKLMELPAYLISLGWYYPRSSDLIARRVVGLPGKIIEIRNKSIYLDEKLFIPNWPIKFEDVRTIPREVSQRDNYQETYIPNDYIFVISDYWDSLSDSRMLELISADQIKGIYWKTLKSGGD